MAKSSYESIAGYLETMYTFVLYWIYYAPCNVLQINTTNSDELASAPFAIDTLYILHIVLSLFARAIASAYYVASFAFLATFH